MTKQTFQRVTASLFAIMVLAGVALAQGQTSSIGCNSLEGKVTTLLAEYKELRSKRSQLAPGTFDKDLNSAGGKLSTVLSSLGNELGHAPFTEKVVTQCMGAPDAIRSHAQMGPLLDIYNREQQRAGHKIANSQQRQYLIYFWRGWHDFLFFISEDGVIVDHGWWFAYE